MPRDWTRLFGRAGHATEARARANQATAASQASQRLLMLEYRRLAREGAGLPSLLDVEFRCFSQNGEDGILLYLFSLLGAPTRLAVEVGAAGGIECNSANLIVNHGWYALLLDGEERRVAKGQAFYARGRDTWLNPPRQVAAWITAENVDGLVRDQGLEGEVDLLSIDVDGMDYWIWKAIRAVVPRVVVMEFNGVLGPSRAATVPYRADFRLDDSRRPRYCGASLAALAKLGKEKGYRLIGVEGHGINAFFARTGIGEDLLPEVTPEECYRTHPSLRHWTERDAPDPAARPDWIWQDV